MYLHACRQRKNGSRRDPRHCLPLPPRERRHKPLPPKDGIQWEWIAHLYDPDRLYSACTHHSSVCARVSEFSVFNKYERAVACNLVACV